MRFLSIVLVAVLTMLQSVSVSAAGNSAEEGKAVEKVTVPDVTGMQEEAAVAALSEVILPDGTGIEIIKSYEYTDTAEDTEVFAQTPVGRVDAAEAAKVNISISMGEEPQELLSVVSRASWLSSFGIAAYTSGEERASGSNLGIDWDNLPCSYEYNWDNSANCWLWGVWMDGTCYKTPWGEYSTDVRHKMQLYCDGTYVYLHIVFSRDYWAKVCGEDYQIWIDGEMSAFQLKYMDGGVITGNTDSLAPGTYQVKVQHRAPELSNKDVIDSLAYMTKYEDNVNAEVELKIPLSEIVRQNDEIDLEHMEQIQFYTPNLMYRRITASGADTLPMATAGAALLLIPASTMLLKRKGGRKEKDMAGKNE